MLVHRGARVWPDADPPLGPLNDQRVVEEPGPGNQGCRRGPRVGHAVQEKRQRREESGERPRRADVDQHALRADRLLDADERTECSGEHEEERRRNEIRESGGHAIAPAHRVVSELMHAEDRHQGNRERQPVRETPAEQRSAPRRERRAARQRRRHEGRGEESEVKERMFPDSAPSPRRRRRGIDERIAGVGGTAQGSAGTALRSSRRSRASLLPSELAATSSAR